MSKLPFSLWRLNFLNFLLGRVDLGLPNRSKSSRTLSGRLCSNSIRASVIISRGFWISCSDIFALLMMFRQAIARLPSSVPRASNPYKLSAKIRWLTKMRNIIFRSSLTRVGSLKFGNSLVVIRAMIIQVTDNANMTLRTVNGRRTSNLKYHFMIAIISVLEGRFLKTQV